MDKEHDAAMRMAHAPRDFRATHKHVKSGNWYQVMARGHECTNGQPLRPVVIYRDALGDTWVRYAPEFDDGRFEAIR